MSVVAGQARRRWAVVAGGIALLCALPVVDSALPVTVPHISAAQLRTRILASADQPYAGYAESDASFGLPSLPGFGDVSSLLDGVTRMRVWQAAPDSWRVDVLADVGERDTYQAPHASYIWDSSSELLTEVLGQSPVRLPRAADLVPSSLALRLLREAGTAARIATLPARRVAGLPATGLRVIPRQPGSTIAQIDIWAEPGNGFPLRVEIFGKGSARPAIETEFLQVSPWRPDKAVLTPQRGPGTAFTQTDAADLSGALGDLGPVLLPATLAGRLRSTTPFGFDEVGLYGQGLGTFAALEIDGSVGLDLIAGARSEGGIVLKGPHWYGVLVSTPLVNAILLHPRPTVGTYVVAGFVDRQILERAARDLAADTMGIQ
ncbi:MAG TPA: hypothetical protein VGI74_08940 [Streptosporangiaceae bacterium]